VVGQLYTDKEHSMSASSPPTTPSKPTIACEQALRIAHLDAEQVYRDLSRFRIQLSLELDGWHIDFELKDTRLHGGGPHYVIDAVNGTILKKRYEQ
jgi:hypothetical protein